LTIHQSILFFYHDQKFLLLWLKLCKYRDESMTNSGQGKT